MLAVDDGHGHLRSQVGQAGRRPVGHQALELLQRLLQHRQRQLVQRFQALLLQRVFDEHQLLQRDTGFGHFVEQFLQLREQQVELAAGLAPGLVDNCILAARLDAIGQARFEHDFHALTAALEREIVAEEGRSGHADRLEDS